MDLSAFSEEDFTSKKWINNIFSDISSTDESEVLVQPLVTKLQLYIQQVNNIIEENCQKTMNCLPKIIKETQSLSKNVAILQKKLIFTKQEIESIEKSTNDSMSCLEKIDRVKTTLKNVKQTLHEADNWFILASDIEEAFDNGNSEKIASMLMNMQQSLNILSNTEDYESKKLQLEGLKNRLEASVSPHIVKAFTTSSIDDAIKFVKLFTQIERLPQLLKYYMKCQKATLCQYWKSIVDSDQDLNLAEQLRSLYDMLLVNWQKQKKWCDEVFASINMIDMMIELYADVLVNLNPSLSSCMDFALKRHTQPLLLLLEFHQISSQFQQNLTSLYVFNNESEKNPNWQPLIKSLYSPYVLYSSKYETLEYPLLNQCLSECYLKIDLQTDFVDSIRNIGRTISLVFSLVHEAHNRCIQLTKGCAMAGLILAYKDLFLTYSEKYKQIFDKLLSQNIDKENWQLLKACLSFQQVIGEFLEEVKKFDSYLLNNVKNQKGVEEIENYVPIILSDVAQNEYKNLLTAVINETKSSLLSNIIEVYEKLSRDVHNFTYKVCFQPISFHLESTKQIWEKLNTENRDLPDYSYSPLEYITQIGEHLITLPQHLEPFLSQEDVALNSVLHIISKDSENISDKGTYANVLLTLVAHGTCQEYSDKILNIRELNSSAVKQLAADINYLGNVLDELGISLAESLQNILTLLRFSPEEYQSKSVGISPRLVAAIRQIRKILST